MACSSCNSSPKTMPQHPVNSLSYSTNAKTVVGKDGHNHPVAKNHVSDRNRPRRGWGASFVINGQSIVVNGANANDVYSQARDQLALNGFNPGPENLWLNLNIQWLAGSDDKYQVVRLSDLLFIASGEKTKTLAPQVTNQPVGPPVWGAKGWGMLQMFLAQDSYDYDRFLVLCIELQKWVDPTVNPSIGCADCYRHYTIALNEIKINPPRTQQDARQWIWRCMNSVKVRNGTPIMSFEQAATVNHWK